MRGKVLGFDPATGQGVINSDDGSRYSIAPGRLGVGVRSLMPGKTVDFVVEGGKAVDIFPLSGGVLDQKNKWVAALLAFFLGGFGVHKFYLGKGGAGTIMLVIFLGGFILAGIPSLIIHAIAFIEGIIYVAKDEQRFYDDYVIGDRAWF
jgi:TM2 domain-containing membrane protein YozV